jgi:uncharacterized Zn finger protein (UPF0148 family)
MSNIICPSCKTPAPPGAIFCDNCGYDLRAITAVDDRPLPQNQVSSNGDTGQKICPNCGHPNLTGSAFCENCGFQLPQEAPAEEPPAEEPPAEEPPAPQASAAPLSPEPAQNAETPSPDPASMAETFVGQSAVTKPKMDSIPGRFEIPAQNVSIPIPSGANSIVIGREDPVSGIFPDIDLDPHGGHEAGVGRKHAQIMLVNGEVFIEDLDSVNGTVVNKKRLKPHEPAPIKHGDELRLGKMILVYETD